MRRQQREEAARQALLQAQKASYRQRSRFQRALGSPAAELPGPEPDGDQYDGLPEDSFSQPAHRCHLCQAAHQGRDLPDCWLRVACAAWKGQLSHSRCTLLQLNPLW